MGSEELKKRRKTHDKYIDKKRAQLSTPGLFTQTPTDQPRCALASVSAGQTLAEGENLVVEAAGGALLARRGQSIVATFNNPPADILSAIRGSTGIASGIVQRVNALSRTAEVAIR